MKLGEYFSREIFHVKFFTKLHIIYKPLIYKLRIYYFTGTYLLRITPVYHSVPQCPCASFIYGWFRLSPLLSLSLSFSFTLSLYIPLCHSQNITEQQEETNVVHIYHRYISQNKTIRVKDITEQNNKSQSYHRTKK